MKKAVPVLVLALLFILCLQAAPDSSASPPAALSKRIDLILGKPALRKVLFSACVVRPDTGEVVYERNAHQSLLPASNMKVVTSAAALERFGADFAFITRVGLCGDSLVVIGSGDPLLGDRGIDGRDRRRGQQVFQDIVVRLKEMGIASISDIILDTSIFDGQRVHPTWPQNQLHQKYACEVSGLNFNGNCVDITAVNLRGRVVLSMDPATDYIKLINAITAGPKRRSWFSVDRTGVSCELLVQGSCRTQAGPYSVAVENPALFFGRLLREALFKADIAVGGQVLEGTVPEGCEFRLITEYKTSIGECLQRINKESLGLAAEALFKRLGAQSNPEGKQGSWEGGRKVLSDYLRGLGVADSEFVIADGSGLSRDDRLSANALTRVLVHLSSLPSWEFYERSLAVGGIDGTIGNHFWERKYRGRIMAKSGYIQAVRALSGIVRTESGDYIFSILANKGGNGARSAIDAAVKAIVDWGAQATVPQWQRKN